MTLRTEPGAAVPFRGELELPSQTANLDRVLTACGWALADDRDMLGEAEDISFGDASGRRPPSRRPSRSVTMRSRPATPAPTAPATPPTPPAESMVSCVIRDLHLRECRADHPPSAQNPAVLMSIRTSEGMEVHPAEGADAAIEGKVVRVIGSRIRIPVG